MPGNVLVSEAMVRSLPAMVRNELARLPDQAQYEFYEEYTRKQKSFAVGYIGWIFFGVHYAYLGRWGWQVLYWITGAGLLVWGLIDLFRIPDMIRQYNRDRATEVLRDLRLITIATPGVSPQVASYGGQPEIKYCRSCGKGMGRSDDFCVQCGAAQN